MNNSSLIDLKAELLRKQQQFKQEKNSSLATGNKNKQKDDKQKKTDVWSRRNAGVLERSQKDIEAKQEEEDTLTKSRKKLEAKARLYESMTAANSIPDEDGSKVFLVDFERKSIDKIVEQREKEREEKMVRVVAAETTIRDDEDKSFLAEPVSQPTDPEEEWVDFTDCLGRSRRCMKKDLPELMEMDKKLSNKIPTKSEESLKNDSSKVGGVLPDLMSSDMYRERLRKQWEREEQEAMDGPTGPVHYANVQHDEIRTHGVGFYKFDKKDEARDEQMEQLLKLREQTKEKRTAHQKLKDKRKAMLSSRLAKVRQRKLMREGKDPGDVQGSDNSGDSDNDPIGPKVAEKAGPEPLTRDDTWRQNAPVRDWDKGKDGLDEFLRGQSVHSENTWMENLRKERNEEFAPPSLYGTGPASAKSASNYKTRNQQHGFFDSNKYIAPKTSLAQIPDPLLAPPASHHVVGSRVLPARAGNKATTHREGNNLTSPSEEPQPDRTSNTLEDHIGQTLSSIRAQVGSIQRGVTEDTSHGFVPVSDIPLPPRGINQQPAEPGTVRTGSVTTPAASLSAQSQEPIGDNSVYTLYQQGVVSSQPVVDHKVWPGFNVSDGNVNASGFGRTETSSTNVSQGIVHIQVPVSGYTGSSQQEFAPQYTTEYAPQAAQYTTEYAPQAAQYTPEYAPQAAQYITESAPQAAQYTTESAPQATPYTSESAPQAAQYTTESAPQAAQYTTESAPQPAHYSSAPQKPQVKKARYERVNLHQLPLNLPVPPTAANVPEYPSQEEVFGPQKPKQMTEDQSAKLWQRQFQYKESQKGHSGGLKPADIPFASPYIQNKDSNKEFDTDPALTFDPCKPPPTSL